jgi:ubiquinone/menaquinone biosynthesis C-methylase UbiE
MGVDLSSSSAGLARRRLGAAGLQRPLFVADAENLPFAADRFDLVYSWGVLHHTPNTERSIREVHRVLKPGGEARIMLYHRRSWVAWQAWIRHGLLAGRPMSSLSDVLAAHVESPGTKAYVAPEIRHMFAPFANVRVESKLTPYDTLDYDPRAVHGRRLIAAAKRLYPRAFVRALGDRFGWNLLITARKA